MKVKGVIDGVTYWITSDNGELTKETEITATKKAYIFTVTPGTTLTIGESTAADGTISSVLPVGEYTVYEVKAVDDETVVGVVKATEEGGEDTVNKPNADMGSMTYLAELSRTEDGATVVKNGTAATSIVNAYTSGKYCIVVTKQWLVNGESADGPDLTVTLSRGTMTGAADSEGNATFKTDNTFSKEFTLTK